MDQRRPGNSFAFAVASGRMIGDEGRLKISPGTCFAVSMLPCSIQPEPDHLFSEASVRACLEMEATPTALPPGSGARAGTDGRHPACERKAAESRRSPGRSRACQHSETREAAWHFSILILQLLPVLPRSPSLCRRISFGLLVSVGKREPGDFVYDIVNYRVKADGRY